MNGLALCSGYGGIELGLEHFFPQFKTICHVEGEAYAAAHLRKKMAEGRLHNAPIWDDVKTFDGSIWRGKVDIITGGFPCQPFSSSGNRKGVEDERWLWPYISKIIGEIRPQFFFFENVPNIALGGLDQIVRDIASLGYDASWCVIGADNIGAPHQRKRWFIFGKDTNTECLGWVKKQPAAPARKFDVERLCDEIPNSSGFDGNKISLQRKHTGWQKFSINGEERRASQRMRNFLGHFEIEPELGRLVDGSPHWVDKLRLLGNGVVPQQAYFAICILWELLGGVEYES